MFLGYPFSSSIMSMGKWCGYKNIYLTCNNRAFQVAKWNSRFSLILNLEAQKVPGDILVTQSLSSHFLSSASMNRDVCVCLWVCVCACSMCVHVCTHMRSKSSVPSAMTLLLLVAQMFSRDTQTFQSRRAWIVGIVQKSGPKDFQD